MMNLPDHTPNLWSVVVCRRIADAMQAQRPEGPSLGRFLSVLTANLLDFDLLHSRVWSMRMKEFKDERPARSRCR